MAEVVSLNQLAFSPWNSICTCTMRSWDRPMWRLPNKENYLLKTCVLPWFWMSEFQRNCVSHLLSLRLRQSCLTLCFFGYKLESAAFTGAQLSTRPFCFCRSPPILLSTLLGSLSFVTFLDSFPPPPTTQTLLWATRVQPPTSTQWYCQISTPLPCSTF